MYTLDWDHREVLFYHDDKSVVQLLLNVDPTFDLLVYIKKCQGY